MIQELKVKNDACPNRYAKRCGRGFSILEVILYVAILSTLVFGIASYLNLVSVSRVKSQIITEVDQQALQIMAVLTQTIGNAESLNTPAVGGEGAVLNLQDGEGGTVEFALSDEKMTINNGGGPTQLSNGRIEVSNLLFKNLSLPSTPDIIQISFTLTYKSDAPSALYNYSKSYVTATHISK